MSEYTDGRVNFSSTPDHSYVATEMRVGHTSAIDGRSAVVVIAMMVVTPDGKQVEVACCLESADIVDGMREALAVQRNIAWPGNAN